jgi:hypothetical protein
MNIAVALCAAVCFSFGVAASAAEFSADLVVAPDTAQTPPAIGKLYVSGNKVRIEDPQLPDGVFLVDGETGAALFYRPARKLVMDARETSVLTQLLVPVAPEQPCVAWQHMAEIAGATQQGGAWRCHELKQPGSAPADTLRYEALSPRNARYDVLIDAARGFPIRIASTDGAVITLDNLRDGASAAALFEPPAGLRKFDPQQLIDRVKQSDVWVEPPK